MAHKVTKGRPRPDLQNDTERLYFFDWKVPDASSKYGKSIKYKVKEGGKTKSKTITFANAISGYTVVWQYYTTDKRWFPGTTETITSKVSTYDPPDNASKIRVKVKANSKTYTNSNNKTAHYFNDGKYTAWFTKQIDNVTNDPEEPSSPTIVVDYEAGTFHAYLATNDENTKTVEFDYCRDDLSNSTVHNGTYPVLKGRATSSDYAMVSGCVYRIRCRGINSLGEVGDWSPWSENIEAAPIKVTDFAIDKFDENAVEFTWNEVDKALSDISYRIEYTTNSKFFDNSPSNVNSSDFSENHAIITGLELGHTWYFRIKAVNGVAESRAWSTVLSITLYKKPDPPIAWSNLSVITDGTSPKIYWIHNPLDGSPEENALLTYTLSGPRYSSPVTKNVYIEGVKDAFGNWESSKTRSYTFSEDFLDTTSIDWKIKTKGIGPDFSEYSQQKTIEFYKKPFLAVEVFQDNGNIVISASVMGTKQTVVGYHYEVYTQTEHYIPTIEGELELVAADQLIFSRIEKSETSIIIQKDDLLLASGKKYKFVVTIATDAGLSVESYVTKIISGDSSVVNDPKLLENLSTILSGRYLTTDLSVSTKSLADIPYCYRIENTGRFTPIVKKLLLEDSIVFTDEKPPLSNGMYRFVYVDSVYGKVTYFETEQPLSFKSLAPSRFNGIYPDEVVDSILIEWEDKHLILPYNVDVSSEYTKTGSLIEYEGRVDPVGAYGIYQSESATWKSEVDKNDYKLLNLVRALAIYSDAVYVREPSGSSFKANVTVTFEQTHNQPAVPITLNVTRIEDGD